VAAIVGGAVLVVLMVLALVCPKRMHDATDALAPMVSPVVEYLGSKK